VLASAASCRTWAARRTWPSSPSASRRRQREPLRIVREKAILGPITTATEIVTKGYEDSRDVKDLLDRAEQASSRSRREVKRRSSAWTAS
jgi:replicative DNA helicase